MDLLRYVTSLSDGAVMLNPMLFLQDNYINKHVMKELEKEKPVLRLVFCSSALGMGFDSPSASRIILVTWLNLFSKSCSPIVLCIMMLVILLQMFLDYPMIFGSTSHQAIVCGLQRLRYLDTRNVLNNWMVVSVVKTVKGNLCYRLGNLSV